MVLVANSDKFVFLDSRLTASSAKVLVNRLFHDGWRYYLVKAQNFCAILYTTAVSENHRISARQAAELTQQAALPLARLAQFPYPAVLWLR